MNGLQEYYLSTHEADRLAKDQAHQLEFLTTTFFLNKYIQSGMTVLDSSAAAGVYAFPLADRGVAVTAGDLMPHYVKALREADKGRLQHIYQADARKLPFASESFDAVMTLGALYHLHEAAERQAVITEAKRVLKPGGLLIAATINRNAVFINHVLHQPTEIASDLEILRTGRNGPFCAADIAETENLLADNNVQLLERVGVDGLIHVLKEQLNAMSPAQFEHYLHYHLQTCTQPSLFSHSMHGLYIARCA